MIISTISLSVCGYLDIFNCGYFNCRQNISAEGLPVHCTWSKFDLIQEEVEIRFKKFGFGSTELALINHCLLKSIFQFKCVIYLFQIIFLLQRTF